MMTESISFSNIVKLIHPDHNPNLTDAGEKMRNVKLFRDDEKTLFKLGVLWGVINSEKTFTTETATPAPSARDNFTEKFRAEKLRKYKDHIANLKESQVNRKESEEESRAFRYRVRNRIFMVGDIVYVRTKRCNVQISKVTATRVYFRYGGKESFAAKKNVRFTRQP